MNRSSDSKYPWHECKYYYSSGGSSEGLNILLCTYVGEGAVGGPLNLWLLLHILKKRRARGSVPCADVIPLQLTVSHLMFYLVLLPLLWNHVSLESERLFSVVTAFTSFVIVMKPVLYCLLCLERHLAVVRPILYLRMRSCRYQWGALVAALAVHIVFNSIMTFVGRSSFTISVLFLLVLLVDVFCSMSILRALRRTPPGDRHSGEMTTVKRKAFITVLILQGALTLNYLPLMLSLPMAVVLPSRTYICQVQMLALAAAVSGSYLQPLLYLHRLGRLRLPWPRPHRPRPDDSCPALTTPAPS